MENKAYSDRRWSDVPKAFTSECSKCIHDHGYAKCDKYPDGIPKEILNQSCKGTSEYKKGYCSSLKKKK